MNSENQTTPATASQLGSDLTPKIEEIQQQLHNYHHMRTENTSERHFYRSSGNLGTRDAFLQHCQTQIDNRNQLNTTNPPLNQQFTSNETLGSNTHNAPQNHRFSLRNDYTPTPDLLSTNYLQPDNQTRIEEEDTDNTINTYSSNTHI